MSAENNKRVTTQYPEAVYSGEGSLTAEVMSARCHRWAQPLHAVEVWREPKAHARYRLLAKANIGTDEFPTTAGSYALRSLMMPDAFCVKRLKAAGCDLFGKATMSELANFVTTGKPNSGYSHLGGFPVNPWDAHWLPGAQAQAQPSLFVLGFAMRR